MQIELNGATHETADDINLADLIRQLELTERRIAVEVNEELIPRSEHASHRLSPGDRIEIVHAIGGG